MAAYVVLSVVSRRRKSRVVSKTDDSYFFSPIQCQFETINHVLKCVSTRPYTQAHLQLKSQELHYILMRIRHPTIHRHSQEIPITFFCYIFPL